MAKPVSSLLLLVHVQDGAAIGSERIFPDLLEDHRVRGGRRRLGPQPRCGGQQQQDGKGSPIGNAIGHYCTSTFSSTRVRLRSSRTLSSTCLRFAYVSTGKIRFFRVSLPSTCTAPSFQAMVRS